jgi:hypothetical protein
MIRATVIHVSICGVLALCSVLCAGWKWEIVPPLPH